MATFRKRGNSWEAQVRRVGFPPVTKSFRNKKTAEAWARQIEQELERTGVLVDRRRLRAATLMDICVRYEGEVSVRKRARDREHYFLRSICRSPLATISLETLSAEHIAAYRDLRLRTLKPASVCRELALLRHVVEIARREWGYPLPSNPVKDVRLPRLPTHRTRRLENNELDRILAVAAQLRNNLAAPLITLAVETGMRRGELLDAKWSNLNEKDATLFLPTTKNGHSRHVPLSPLALAALNRLPRTCDRIIPMTANAVRLMWERLLRRAEVHDLHFHDLRHEAISRFFEIGLSIAEVAAVSGHRDFRMLFRYTHPRPAHIARKLKLGVNNGRSEALQYQTRVPHPEAESTPGD